MRNTRLLLAYGISAWGAVAPLLLLWLGAEMFVRVAGPGWHYDLFVTTPWHFAALVVIGYVVGAALLPLYWVFERRGWRGWTSYIPTAIVAAFAIELVLDIATTSWAATAQRGSGGIRALCLGLAAEFMVAVIAGAACGGIFSLVLRGLRRGRTEVRPYA